MRSSESERQHRITGKASEGFRLSPQQNHLWSLEQLDRNSPYRVQCSVLIEGNVDIGALNAVLRKIWSRHEILRTSFHSGGSIGSPIQVIIDAAVLSIDSYNLAGWDSVRQEARIETLCQEANRASFDFENGKLSHVVQVTLSASRHILLINSSAQCADTKSLDNLVSEICRRLCDASELRKRLRRASSVRRSRGMAESANRVRGYESRQRLLAQTGCVALAERETPR